MKQVIIKQEKQTFEEWIEDNKEELVETFLWNNENFNSFCYEEFILK